MLSRVYTVSFQGIEVLPVRVEVQIANGLPSFTIVGLADKAVAESRERVRSALSGLGLSLPPKRITVNLAPANIVKEGSHFDLPIALGLLSAMEIIPERSVSSFTIMGELGLDGTISGVTGILPAAIFANSLNQGFICPFSQGSEAAWSGISNILAASSLLELINHFKGLCTLPYPEKLSPEVNTSFLDIKDIKGQESAKRALEIAAAGGHNLLLIGPPGAGKSMLASRLPSLLPALTSKEILEVSMIHSIAGMIKEGRLVSNRPYRSPHHSASMVSLVGGGNKAKPGEVSLAHKGVLFLDELPEFQRSALEALRQPLETGSISISRANLHVSYPAKFQLVAAMNPCRCGYLGTPGQECSRAPKCGEEYQSKISGPLLDRIDMHIEVPSVPPWDMTNSISTETSAEIAKRVFCAVSLQISRYKGSKISRNSEADGEILEEFSHPDSEGEKLLITAAEQLKLSARGYNRVLRVARTIADLGMEEKVRAPHIAEALSFRRVIHRNHFS